MKAYTLEKDHANIKKQIKQWEKKIDRTIIRLLKHKENHSIDDLVYTLEALSHEMTAINI